MNPLLDQLNLWQLISYSAKGHARLHGGTNASYKPECLCASQCQNATAMHIDKFGAHVRAFTGMRSIALVAGLKAEFAQHQVVWDGLSDLQRPQSDLSWSHKGVGLCHSVKSTCCPRTLLPRRGVGVGAFWFQVQHHSQTLRCAICADGILDPTLVKIRPWNR